MSFPGADAARFVEAAQTWLADAAEGQHGGLDTGAAECGVCPLCRAARTLRTADPAVVAAVIDAIGPVVTGVVDLLREAGERLLATDTDRLRHDNDAAADDAAQTPDPA